jgi:hypothetical protein
MKSSSVQIPIFNTNVELLVDDDITYLYHRFDNKVFILENSIAVDIINSVDGKNSILDISSRLTEKYPVDDVDEVIKDVTHMLSDIEKAGFISY